MRSESESDSESEGSSEASDGEEKIAVPPPTTTTTATGPTGETVSATPSGGLPTPPLSTSPQSLPIPVVIVEEGTAETLIKLIRNTGLAKVLFRLYSRLQKDAEGEKTECLEDGEGDLFSSDKSVVVKPDAFLLRRGLQAASFEIRAKPEGGQGKAAKALLSSNALIRSILAINSRSQLALAEGSQVSLVDAAPLLQKKGPSAIDRSALPVLSSTELKFDVMSLRFNPLNSAFLAVIGIRECLVFTFNPR